MIPVYRDIELSRDKKIPVQPPSPTDYWERTLIEPLEPVDMEGALLMPSRNEIAPIDSQEVVKAGVGGVKLWHLLVVLGVLVLLKKR